jgi:hypothetical protein
MPSATCRRPRHTSIPRAASSAKFRIGSTRRFVFGACYEVMNQSVGAYNSVGSEASYFADSMHQDVSQELFLKFTVYSTIL